jgi:hypothetical protein
MRAPASSISVGVLGKGSRLVADLPLDQAVFACAAADLSALSHTHVADGVGEWAMTALWQHSDNAGPLTSSSKLPLGLLGFVNQLAQFLDFEPLQSAWIFVAANGGYIRAHKDWPDSKPRFTRLHVPLSSSPDCLSSEARIVYRMNVGEVWYLDGGRIHSAINLGPTPRIHLILDYPPYWEPHGLLIPACQVNQPPAPIPLPTLANQERDSIAGLSRLITPNTFELVVALLGAIHFHWEADAGDMYNWLDMICSVNGSEELMQLSKSLRCRSIGESVDCRTSLEPSWSL